jgi:hypothetical protein
VPFIRRIGGKLIINPGQLWNEPATANTVREFLDVVSTDRQRRAPFNRGFFLAANVLGLADVVTPFHHLSEDSHINCPLRAGPITASKQLPSRGGHGHASQRQRRLSPAIGEYHLSPAVLCERVADHSASGLVWVARLLLSTRPQHQSPTW